MNHQKHTAVFDRIAVFIIVFAVVLLFSYYLLRIGNHSNSNPVVQKSRKALLIGNALLHYQEDHAGQWPIRLSDLVPRYIPSTNASCFFGPQKSEAAANSISENLFSEIDNKGMFVYLGERGFQENLVLYERMNLWPQGENAASVVTLTTNCIVMRVSAKDVETRLSHLPSVGTTP